MFFKGIISVFKPIRYQGHYVRTNYSVNKGSTVSITYSLLLKLKLSLSALEAKIN
ncbi:hypothetical protein ESA2_CDS48 [Staphylococcus phage ESa2]|nr:hypothetical protein ESA2_CDS48 [Staphylococcus phage ESa2]